jgi:hypothetical protein
VFYIVLKIRKENNVTTQYQANRLGSALVISAVMLRIDVFDKVIAYLGILASLLLLGGDFSAGVIPPMASIATLLGLGTYL